MFIILGVSTYMIKSSLIDPCSGNWFVVISLVVPSLVHQMLDAMFRTSNNDQIKLLLNLGLKKTSSGLKSYSFRTNKVVVLGAPYLK
jgi:hypothetical protein